MNYETLSLTYDYSPYRSQDDQEIPAFEIFNESGDKIADTNEDQPAEYQEAIAALLVATPELLRVLQAAGQIDWVHNAAITEDREALRHICLQYAKWWNEQALPLITQFSQNDHTTDKESEV